MMLAIELYSVDPALVTPSKVVEVLSMVGFGGPLRISRSKGPENYFALTKKMLAGARSGSFPPTDLEDVACASAEEAAAYLKPKGPIPFFSRRSVLRISYSRSERIGALVPALAEDVPENAKGFFHSSNWLSFGPTDLVEYCEDAEGQDDVRLVDVAEFVFSVTCDFYRGDFSIFREVVPALPAFVSLRDDLEQVSGP